VIAVAEERGGLAGIVLTHAHLDHSESVPLLRAVRRLRRRGPGAVSSGPFRSPRSPGSNRM
jgi:glyoxylase-like metal-dependent hydrolase (beta-lactamase superfamily II)